MRSKSQEGFLYGLVAYGWWGLVPLYFRWLHGVAPAEILAHRVVWSLVFLAGVLAVARRWPDVVRCLTSRALLVPLTCTAVLIALNWFAYIYSVDQRKIVQASLGYYITPLVSVMLGLLLFRERLRPLQWLALGLAAIGVAQLTLSAGEFPWISLVLAGSFSLYGALRKKTPVDGLVGLSVETILLVPAALLYLALLQQLSTPTFAFDEWSLSLKLMLSGVVTAIPLLCFGQAARRLPLSALGFMQYVSPTIQLLVAVFLFGEAVPGGGWASFYLIWIALLVFSVDSVRSYRRAERLRAEAA